MTETSVIYKEIRFVIEEDLTQVYILTDVQGDSLPNLQGWHHRAYPPSVMVDEIIQKMFADDEDDPLLWPLKAPS